MQIEDFRIKRLRGKEIPLVRVTWGEASGESLTWELESEMRSSYPEFFEAGNFRGQKFFKEGEL